LESLALVVTIILFGLVFIGLVGPILAILLRRNKLGQYWVIGYLVLLGALTALAWQGSSALGVVPLIAAAITGLIAFWPRSNK
jgi:hypothetical protein